MNMKDLHVTIYVQNQYHCITHNIRRAVFVFIKSLQPDNETFNNSQRPASNMCRLLLIQSVLLVKFIGTTICSPLATHAILPITTIENAHHPQYAFNYAVYDPHTNDKKAHWETRNGPEVNGAYSLQEPDGSIRIVEYNANDVKGFTAVVKKIGNSVHPTKIVQNVPLILNPVVSHVTEKTVHPLPIPIPLPPPPPAHIGIPQKVHLQPHVEIRQEIGHNIVPSAYGLGAAALPIGVSNVVFERGSHPWDPITGTYGGWRPFHGAPKDVQATLIARKYINGHLHKVVTGPISLFGKTLLIKKSHR
ncbi:unnamed protein product [Pieris macdunnoughi]|uniref:Uncharacterized protein n=1 Tax=Pieris macdunnoughi TaxID=345717 RepID=A0A821PMS5_9NEOP|nr:unnamed protein product [Pieris macdunnoughi]